MVLWRAKPYVWAAVYTGELRSRESYSVGLDAWFPAKPFYMELAGNTWSRPSAMDPPSRWTYSDPAVCVEVLSAECRLAFRSFGVMYSSDFAAWKIWADGLVVVGK